MSESKFAAHDSRSSKTHVWPLEANGSEFAESIRELLEHLIPFLDHRPTARAVCSDVRLDDPAHQSTTNLLYDSNWPSESTSLRELLRALFEVAIPPGFDAAAPGYLSFIPGGGLPDTAMADLIANLVNRYVGIRRASPGLARIDETVLSWFRQLVGYGIGSGGYLAPGGSIANLTAIIMARHHRLGEEISRGTLYASEQTHHSIAKAAIHAGINATHVRRVPNDSRGRIVWSACEALIEQDRQQGLMPFLIVSNAGTTNTGAIDDQQEAFEVAKRCDVDWHVDAAYGGFFLLTDRGQQMMQGIGRADSITVDPHKSLFLPYGTGCLLVKNVQRLKQAFDLRGAYMPRRGEAEDEIDACDLSPEQTRAFRGLRIWLPLKRHGVQAFRDQLDEKLDLTQAAYRALKEAQASGLPIELTDEPQLTVIAMRLAPSGMLAEDADRLTDQWLDAINSDGRIVLSPTRIDGRVFLRMCILSFRTHATTIDQALEIIVATARLLVE